MIILEYFVKPVANEYVRASFTFPEEMYILDRLLDREYKIVDEDTNSVTISLR